MASTGKRMGEVFEDAAQRKKPRLSRPDGFDRPKHVKPTSARPIPAPQFHSAFESVGDKPRSSGAERTSGKPPSSGGARTVEKPRSTVSGGKLPPLQRLEVAKPKDGPLGMQKRLVVPPRPPATPASVGEKQQKPASSSKKTVQLKHPVWAGDPASSSKKPVTSAPRPPAFPLPAPAAPVSAPRPPAFPLGAPASAPVMKLLVKPPQYRPPAPVERPSTPPLLRPITRPIAFEPPRAATAKRVPMKAISAFAADVGSAGGKADVFGMFLRQHGVRFVSEGERELGRGLEVSPEKLKGGGGSGGSGGGARYLRWVVLLWLVGMRG
ncbi:hypothetical protein OF83DRAFT_1179575 [Amylostereum chailletii]|nr:hypothetical protein OF83DRAFT_1179575 [Amylostereum chailletii]